MMEVVAIARMVPMGMDFWASRKSPDRFDPAMIPGGGGGQQQEIKHEIFGNETNLYALQYGPDWELNTTHVHK